MSSLNEVPRVYLAADIEQSESDCACADGEATPTAWFDRVWKIIVQTMSSAFSETLKEDDQTQME